MTTVTCPAGLLDPTGKDDVADKLRGWLATVPSGESATDMNHAVIPPGTYRNEGGIGGAVTMTGKANVSLDMSGVHFVQRTKRPFAVIADPSNGTENPAGRWNIVYTPTLATKATFEGWTNKVSAQERANAKCKLLNRERDFFKFNKCVRVRLRGARMTGGAGIDPTFDKDFEAQNGVGFYGSVDCELEVVIEQVWGNGIEANRYDESDGSYLPTVGLWVHDGSISDCGRQALSLSYGRAFTVERCDLAGSVNGRSLIDMEPTTDRNPPGQEATVQGVYVIDNRIGKHRLGMIAAGLTIGDVRNIYVARNVGNSIGISGTSVARRVIFEDNTDTDRDSSPNMCKFLRGPHGGEDYIVRRNRGLRLTEAVVKFHDGGANGGCTNYLVADNDAGGRPQFIDNNVPKWSGKFVPFTLPIPAHALRDLP